MKLSVILLTYNSMRYLERCLDSVLADARTLGPGNFELLVVDNGSTDGSPEFVASRYPAIRLIRNAQNRGIGRARNQGLAACQGVLMLVLDIDTVVRPGAIAGLVRLLELNPRVGLGGAKLIGEDGRLQYTCRLFPTVISKLLRQLPEPRQRVFLKDENMIDWDHAQPRDVDYVIGACQMIRRKAWLEVGPYDERIFYGPEDVDYCLRMWAHGWRVAYCPQAVIVHAEQRRTRSLDGALSKMGREHFKGLALYFWKHRYLFRRPQVRLRVLRDLNSPLDLRLE